MKMERPILSGGAELDSFVPEAAMLSVIKSGEFAHRGFFTELIGKTTDQAESDSTFLRKGLPPQA